MMRGLACFVWAAALVLGDVDEYRSGQLGDHHFQELVTPFVKSLSDKREYLGLVLANKMKVLLVSDPTANQAAAALDVAVGFGADPREMQGLAHFCEHLLFMGTKKYPDVDEFTDFIANNGGENNAYTDYGNTNYHFKVSPDHLDGALDRFAQFFVAPLFDETAVEKEVEAVESELTLDMESDVFRNDEVMKLLSNQSHPFAFNNNGNKQTLYDGPISKDIKPRQKVVEFYEKYYSAHLMSLVVIGRESLEKLKGLTIPKFAAVPAKKTFLPTRGSPVSADQVGIQVGVDSLSYSRSMVMQFLLPSYTLQYRGKPLRILSEALGYEGPGSVKALLQKKKWIVDVETWVRISNVDFSTVEIVMDILPAGLDNKEAIVQLYLDYARLVQNGAKPLYDEMKSLAEIELQQQETPDPIVHASDLASSMQLGLLSESLSIGLFREFNETLVKEAFSHIRLDNLRLSVISKSPTNTLKHPVYDINYSKQKLNPQRFISTSETLELPKPNPYIPRNFALLKTNPRVVALKETPRGSLWYAGIPSGAPKAVVRVLLQRIPESPGSKVALEMLVDALRVKLTGTISAAQRAGLNIEILATGHGLSFLFEGYSDMMKNVVNEAMQQLRTMTNTEDDFGYAKELCMYRYGVFPFYDPAEQAEQYKRIALSESTWPYPALNDSAASITHGAFQAFAKSVLAAPSKVLVVGNLVRDTARRIREFTLPTKVPTTVTPSAAVVMPRGDFVFSAPLANSNEKNSAIVFYLELYAYPDSLDETMAGFLAFLLDTLAFDQLRTEEQLGYSVSASIHDLGTRGGIAFRITSVYEPVHLESRIEALLAKFRKDLEGKTEDELKELSEGYAVSLKKSTLLEKADAAWDEIEKGHYRFQKGNVPSSLADIADQQIREHLDKITSKMLLDVVDTKMLKGASARRKFSVHAVSSQPKKSRCYSLEKCGRILTQLANWAQPYYPCERDGALEISS